MLQLSRAKPGNPAVESILCIYIIIYIYYIIYILYNIKLYIHLYIFIYINIIYIIYVYIYIYILLAGLPGFARDHCSIILYLLVYFIFRTFRSWHSPDFC